MHRKQETQFSQFQLDWCITCSRMVFLPKVFREQFICIRKYDITRVCNTVLSCTVQ